MYANILTNRDGNFGLSFQKTMKKYFKEYEVELFGKDSPGPQQYNITTKDF